MARDESTGNFTYSSTPQPVRPATKYRINSASNETSNNSNKNNIPIVNLMSDPRVMRGSASLKAKNTIESIKPSTTKVKLVPPDIQRSHPTYEYVYKSANSDNYDLSKYLVDPNDLREAKIKDNKSQTDQFNDFVEKRIYIPRKTGIDVSTQVEDTMELFSFDLEVEPIVQVLVNKTIEQAKLELFNEDTIEYLIVSRSKYLEELEKYDEWVKQQEHKIAQEYKKSIAITNEKISQHQELTRVRTYIAGLQMSSQIYPSIVNEIISQCYKTKLWKDSEKEYIHKYILPELIDKVKSSVSSFDIAESVLNEILLDSCNLYDDTLPSISQPANFSKIDVSIIITPDRIESEEEEEKSIEQQFIGSYFIDNTTTFLQLYNQIYQSARERSIPLELITKDKLYKYFVQQVGRDIALDGSFKNFNLPSSLTMIF